MSIEYTEVIAYKIQKNGGILSASFMWHKLWNNWDDAGDGWKSGVMLADLGDGSVCAVCMKPFDPDRPECPAQLN